MRGNEGIWRSPREGLPCAGELRQCRERHTGRSTVANEDKDGVR